MLKIKPTHQAFFKFCPHCGQNQFSSTDGQRFFCENCQFEYYHNTASAVAGIIIYGPEILVVTRNKSPCKGQWDLPGGFVDHNESLENALTREVEEELGLNINQWHYLSSSFNTYQYNAVSYKTCDAIFYAHLSWKPEFEIQANEISNFDWVETKDLNLNRFAFPSLRDGLEKFITRQKEAFARGQKNLS